MGSEIHLVFFYVFHSGVFSVFWQVMQLFPGQCQMDLLQKNLNNSGGTQGAFFYLVLIKRH